MSHQQQIIPSSAALRHAVAVTPYCRAMHTGRILPIGSVASHFVIPFVLQTPEPPMPPEVPPGVPPIEPNIDPPAEPEYVPPAPDVPPIGDPPAQPGEAPRFG